MELKDAGSEFCWLVDIQEEGDRLNVVVLLVVHTNTMYI